MDKEKFMNFENYDTWEGFPHQEDSLLRSQEFYQFMNKRRSIREFSSEKVDRAVIENALKTAGTAPSGNNCQPWHFVVVESQKAKQRIRAEAESVEKEFYSNPSTKNWVEDLKHLGTTSKKPYLEEAPYLILVFTQYPRGPKGQRTQTYYPLESTGIAVGFLISALHNAGLATLTHTPKPMKFLNEISGLDNSYRPFVLLVTGKPKQPIRVPKISRKELGELASFI